MKDRFNAVRNVVGVATGAAGGVIAIVITIPTLVLRDVWASQKALSLGISSALLTVVTHLSDVLLGLAGGASAGIIAGIVSTSGQRRKCGVFAAGLAWLIVLFWGKAMWPGGSWMSIINSFSLVRLCASIVGGLLGAIVYEEVRTKWPPETGPQSS